MLSVEERPRSDLAAECEPELERPLDRRRVRRRQRAGKGETHRTRLRVRFRRERVRAAAEHLRLRLELYVDLQADHRLPIRHRGTPSPAATEPRYPHVPRRPRGT